MMKAKLSVAVAAGALALAVLAVAPVLDSAQGGAEPQGERGPAGVALTARIQEAAPVTTANSDRLNPVTWELTGNEWTQGPAETDLFVGQFTLHHPTSCTAPLGMTTGGWIDVFMDGEILASGGTFFTPFVAGQAQTLPLSPRFNQGGAVFGSGANADHVVTAKVWDLCGAETGEEYTFESLQVDVIAIG